MFSIIRKGQREPVNHKGEYLLTVHIEDWS